MSEENRNRTWNREEDGCSHRSKLSRSPFRYADAVYRKAARVSRYESRILSHPKQKFPFQSPTSHPAHPNSVAAAQHQGVN